MSVNDSPVSQQIDRIEILLQSLCLYSQQAPTESAMKSTMPFCYDEMKFHEWLQWVLIPRTRDLISTGQPLPSVSNIYAIAEIELLALPQDTDELLSAVQKLDELFKQY